MAATVSNPIIFYDIIAKDGGNWSPNTYKTRLTLNYKGLPYRVKWVKIEDVESTMKAMGIAPTSNIYPYYTLPMIADPSSDLNGEPVYVSESFQIAVYLDDKYSAPGYPVVLPVETRALQKIFVDDYLPTLYTPLLGLLRHKIPKLLDENSEGFFCNARGGKDNFSPLPEAEAMQMIVESREQWNTLSQTLELTGGPWTIGNAVSFADFAIGGWLFVCHKADGDEGKVWKEVSGWQNGKWGAFRKHIETIESKSTEVL